MRRVLAALALAVPAFTSAAPPAAPSPDEVRSAAERVERIRELRFRKPVSIVRIGAAGVRAALARELDLQYAFGEWEDRTRLLGELGLIPRDYALRERLLDLATEQVVGFYVPRTKELAIVQVPAAVAGPVPAAALYEAVVPHELAHALVDQHFDLAQLLEDESVRHRDDLLFARHALAEGDATLVMLIASLEAMNVKVTPEVIPGMDVLRAQIEAYGMGFPELGDAPPFMRAQLMEPYLLGLDLVVRAWKEGGWKAVDRCWRRPPESTEQLLHPGRRDDAPVEVRAGGFPEGWTLRHHAEMGELALRTWLAAALPQREADDAAAGWDGDRAMLLERPFRPPLGSTLRYPAHATGVYLRSVWDGPDEAKEFARAAERWLAASVPAAEDEWSVRRYGALVEVFFARAPEPLIEVEPIAPETFKGPPVRLQEGAR